jgi:hypothetical protein
MKTNVLNVMLNNKYCTNMLQLEHKTRTGEVFQPQVGFFFVCL